MKEVYTYGEPSSYAPQFTGKERDAETGLDFFGARYFSSPQGRFTSPDSGNAGASKNNPQSRNGYSYWLNSPLRYIDRNRLDQEYYLVSIPVFAANANTWIATGAGVIMAQGWPVTYWGTTRDGQAAFLRYSVDASGNGSYQALSANP